MASTKKMTDSKGNQFYKIIVSGKKNEPQHTERWYVPSGYTSEKAIQKALDEEVRRFVNAVADGSAMTRKEKAAKAEAEAAEEAKIQTVQQYGEKVFMPAKTVTCTEHTRDNFQRMLDLHIYPIIGAEKMTEVKSVELTKLLLDFQADGHSQASAVKIYVILNSLFKAAYMTDVIEKNPMDKVSRPKATADEVKTNGEAESLTEEELADIMGKLNALPEDDFKWKLFFNILIDSGMRCGECSALHWEDIDLTTGRVTVRRSLGYTRKAGIYEGLTKSKATRSFFLSPEVLAMLNQFANAGTETNGVIDFDKAKAQQEQEKPTGYIFRQDGTDLPMHPDAPKTFLRRFGKANGYPELHPHLFRHTFASLAVTNGADITSVSAKLGHSDTAVTLRMYSHANEESIQRASEIFRQAIRKQA